MNAAKDPLPPVSRRSSAFNGCEPRASMRQALWWTCALRMRSPRQWPRPLAGTAAWAASSPTPGSPGAGRPSSTSATTTRQCLLPTCTAPTTRSAKPGQMKAQAEAGGGGGSLITIGSMMTHTGLPGLQHYAIANRLMEAGSHGPGSRPDSADNRHFPTVAAEAERSLPPGDGRRRPGRGDAPHIELVEALPGTVWDGTGAGAPPHQVLRRGARIEIVDRRLFGDWTSFLGDTRRRRPAIASATDAAGLSAVQSGPGRCSGRRPAGAGPRGTDGTSGTRRRRPASRRAAPSRQI